MYRVPCCVLYKSLGHSSFHPIEVHSIHIDGTLTKRFLFAVSRKCVILHIHVYGIFIYGKLNED